jgi:hypothetical protein
VSRPGSLRPQPGHRPAAPVRQEDPPDDWLCTWAYRIAVWSDGSKTGVWELKYVNAACLEHARLPAA